MSMIIINPADAIAVADINGTIFSIILGFISAYALYVYSKAKELEIQIIQEASKINTTQLHLHTIRTSGAKKIEQIFDSSVQTQRIKLLDRLTDIGTQRRGHNLVSSSVNAEFIIGHSKCLAIPLIASDSLTPSHLGEETIQILSAILNNYPFASLSGSYMPDGKFIEFNDLDAIQKWTIDMEGVLYNLMWTISVQREIHQENINAYLNQDSGGIHRSISQFEISDFFQAAKEIKELVRSVKLLLTQMEARKPNKKVIMNGLIISILGILTGVIAPMINKDCSPWVFLLFPILCYVVIFAYMISFLAKK